MIDPQQYRDAKIQALHALENGWDCSSVQNLSEYLANPQNIHLLRLAAQIKSIIIGGTCKEDLRENQNFGFSDEVHGSMSKSQWVDILNWEKDLK